MTVEAATRAPQSLESTRVEEVMHRGVVSCSLETPLRTVARAMAVRRVHCVVGVGDASEGDTTLWGVVSDRDVLAAAAVGDIDECDAGSCVGTEVATISPESSVRDAARIMNQRGVSHLVVVRPGSDKPLGVVSTLDIAGAVGGVPAQGAPRPAMRVDQLMSAPVVTAAPETSLKDAASLLVERGISGLPVVAEGEVVGILSEADIVAFERGPAGSARERTLTALLGRGVDASRVTKTVAEAMSRPVITVSTWQSAASAASLMTKHGVKRLPVMEKGQLVGIVSRRDLVRAFARSDADIARDVREEVLLRELWLSPEDVGVEVHGGEVSLTGSVDSEITADLLPAVVRKVPGVVSVESSVVVRQ
jgi:CBS domain-containing protein